MVDTLSNQYLRGLFIIMETKICKKCGLVKSKEDFAIDKNKKSHRNYCKKCRIAYIRGRRQQKALQNPKYTIQPIEGEVWKDIIDFEGIYQVSSIGRVKSLERTYTDKNEVCYLRRSQILSLLLGNGYHHVWLKKKGGNKHAKVHRLVAQAFIPNPENKPEVNHKDTIKTNNAVENLEWSTPKENTQHAADLGLMNRFGPHKLTVDDVNNIFRLKALHNSFAQIQKILGINSGTCRMIYTRKIWKHLKQDENGNYYEP